MGYANISSLSTVITATRHGEYNKINTHTGVGSGICRGSDTPTIYVGDITV